MQKVELNEEELAEIGFVLEEVSGIYGNIDSGEVYLRKSGAHSSHFTYGSNNGNDYKRVKSTKLNKYVLVHTIIARLAYGECPEGYEIDHINRKKDDNRASNLRYVSHSTNQLNKGDYNKKVVCYNDKGVRVYYFANFAEVKAAGLNQGNVSSACREKFNRPGNRRYKELNWFYANDEESINAFIEERSSSPTYALFLNI